MDISYNFILFALIAGFSPGPNNIMIMASGLNHGLRASVPHLIGVCLGVPTLMMAIGVGFGYLFEQFVALHLGIKIVGTFYLVYLAYKIAMSAPAEVGAEGGVPLTFSQAALFQLVNPKAWIIGSSAIAAYTSVGEDTTWQIVGIVLVLFVVTVAAVSVWLVFGVALQRVLRNPRHQRLFNYLMALFLLVSIWPIVAELVTNYVL